MKYWYLVAKIYFLDIVDDEDEDDDDYNLKDNPYYELESDVIEARTMNAAKKKFVKHLKDIYEDEKIRIDFCEDNCWETSEDARP